MLQLTVMDGGRALIRRVACLRADKCRHNNKSYRRAAGRKSGQGRLDISHDSQRALVMDVSLASHDAKSGLTADSSPDEAEGFETSVGYSPAEIVRRQSTSWQGLRAETAQVVSREYFEYRYNEPYHLLIAAEEAARSDGETLVEGLPRSTRREFSRRLTFIPAGRAFFGSQYPRLLLRSVYLYIDPHALLLDPELGFADADFEPRLFFEKADLWQTVLKLKTLIGINDAGTRMYAETLCGVLGHEIMRLDGSAARAPAASCGGLAGWQRKRVAGYIEEHLTNDVPLAVLADLARLSPYHFVRSFKRSFGQPPHRYFTARRMERAKFLLASPDASITQIALDLGFSSTGSFSATFHRVIGRTPTSYRRCLE
jgi:AraC family transcriptional regulator